MFQTGHFKDRSSRIDKHRHRKLWMWLYRSEKLINVLECTEYVGGTHMYETIWRKRGDGLKCTQWNIEKTSVKQKTKQNNLRPSSLDPKKGKIRWILLLK